MDNRKKMTSKASDRHQCIPLKEDVLTDTSSSNWNKNQVTNKLSYTFDPHDLTIYLIN